MIGRKEENDRHEIQFEKEQEIGFEIGSKVIILENTEDIWNTYTIRDINFIKGFLSLTPNKKVAIPRNKPFTLVPEKNDFYKKNLFSSLLKTANDFSPAAPYFGLKKCLHDLLLRKGPDLGSYKGALILNKDEIIKEASAHILNLNQSVFCFQGPPGTGKTYTAAHIILNLVKRKKTVGLTANSHKAILNILKTIHEQNKEALVFPCQKVRDSKNPLEEKELLEAMKMESVQSRQVKSGRGVSGRHHFFFLKTHRRTKVRLFICG